MSDKDIIALLKQKDRQSIRLMYERYSPVMLAICIRYTKDRETAKDLMHEGFIKILMSIDSYKGEGSLEGWLKRVMVNSVIDALKKKKGEATYSMDDEFDVVEEDTPEEVEEDRKDVEAARPMDVVKKASLASSDILEEVKKLPAKYGVIFNLFVLDEMSHKDIAKKLKIDEGVSRTRLNRARDMIKAALYEKSILRIAK